MQKKKKKEFSCLWHLMYNNLHAEDKILYQRKKTAMT